MARSIKKGLDYFPLDVNDDRKWKLLRAKYGIKGIGVFVELLRIIYSEGYYYPWDEESQLIFAHDTGITIDFLTEIVDFLTEKGFFQEEKRHKMGILTSHGIQIRYLKACECRSKIIIEDKFRLFELDELPEGLQKKVNIITPFNKEENIDFQEENGHFQEENTSAGEENSRFLPENDIKKSKVKKSKVNNINVTLPQISDLKPFIAFYKKSLKQRGNIEYPEEFETWWKSYPRQEDKKAAFLQWLINLEIGVDFIELQNAAENYKDHVLQAKTEIKYIKHPKTFLGSSEPWREYIKARASPEKKTGWEDLPDYLDGTKTGFDFSEDKW
ncbi:MAG: DUF4373 domain-containing protein [Spirochaetales bacterium]|nr:DUF4373 domain-containing protein [Spirochaetales bacterium]